MPAKTLRQYWYHRSQFLTRPVPQRAAYWLFDATSLTARLIRQYGSSFHVRLLSQSYRSISADEKQVMGLQHGHACLIREVLLCDGKRALVYARTVIPVSTLRGALRRYANLGNRPLGAMLFADRTMRRGEMEITMALPQRCCRALLADIDVDASASIWGRRSVFRVSGKPLLVSEYFLPSLMEDRQ